MDAEITGVEGFKGCCKYAASESGVCSGCSDGSGIVTSSTGTSALGIVLVSGTILVSLAGTIAREVVGIPCSCVAASSWLLRADRDGVVSGL